jgi:hypothetical protein
MMVRIKKAFFSIVMLGVGLGIGFGEVLAQELSGMNPLEDMVVSFKRFRRSRKVVFDNCNIIAGHSRIVIDGGYLQVSGNKKLGAVKLPNKFRFFGCGVDSRGVSRLIGKRKLNENGTLLNITLSNFKPISRNGLAEQCSKVAGWPSGLIYKTIGSTHFDPGDMRRTTIGLIASPGAPVSGASGCTEMYDSEGNEVARFGLYSTNDGWKFRAYSATGCGGSGKRASEVASEALKNTNSANVYVKLGGTCYGPIDPRRCIGSSQC